MTTEVSAALRGIDILQDDNTMEDQNTEAATEVTTPLDDAEMSDDEVVGKLMEIDGVADLLNQDDAGSETIREVVTHLAPLVGDAPRRIYRILATLPLVKSALDAADGKTATKKVQASVESAIKKGIKDALRSGAKTMSKMMVAPVVQPNPRADKTWDPSDCTPAEGSGYQMNDHGVTVEVQTRLGLTTRTIIGERVEVVSEVEDIDTHEGGVLLRFRKRGRWETLAVGRDVLLSAQKLAQIVPQGVTIASADAGEATRYFAHILRHHAQNLPQQSTSRRCGWRGNAFVLGKQTIGGDNITFAHPDPAVVALVDVLGPSPDWTLAERDAKRARWKEMAQRLADKPIVVLALAASLAAPLIHDLPIIQNLIVDIYGDSTGGKSTTTRFASSIWGNPAEGLGLFRPWKDTVAYSEEAAGVMNDLPMFRDESKVAPPGAVADWTFSYANGGGKGRSNATGGVRASTTFRGVLLSTGEHSITTYSTDNGVLARVIGVTGSPLGEDQKPLSDEITAVALSCYGLIGREMLAQYIADREHWSKRLVEAPGRSVRDSKKAPGDRRRQGRTELTARVFGGGSRGVWRGCGRNPGADLGYGYHHGCSIWAGDTTSTFGQCPGRAG